MESPFPGFRLAAPPPVPPRLFVAALREGMLRMAGAVADGVLLNWLGADDMARVVRFVHDEGEHRQVVARLFVCPSEDEETVRAQARRMIAGYLTVPACRRHIDRYVAAGVDMPVLWVLPWGAGVGPGIRALAPAGAPPAGNGDASPAGDALGEPPGVRTGARPPR